MKSLFCYILFTLFFCTSSSILATNSVGHIMGKITDKTQQPIVGASIILKGTVRGVSTNEKGEYLFKNVEIGTYTLVISSLGYETEEKMVEILRGGYNDP
jgi:Fe(3+) dicitrate transport protein